MGRQRTNVPALRDNNVPFYERSQEDALPTVNGRRPRPHPNCYVCAIVPRLQQQGYTFEEAADVEEDLYRHLYTFWPAKDISRWLRRSHGYEVSHDAVSRHRNNHMSDPALAMFDRVSSYAPAYMNNQFLKGMADTLKLVALKFRDDVSTERVHLTPSEFIAVFKILQEWGELQRDGEEHMMDVMMEVMDNALEDTLADHPELKNEFLANVRKQLSELEEEYEGQE